MIGLIVKAILSPLLSLGGKYLDNQRDKARLDAATNQLVYSADASIRPAKWASWMGRLPLFIAEVSASLYFASIMVDSTFPMEWLTPLELPNWFKPHFYVAAASIFGIATVDRWLRK